jgi:hypothetical protein
MRNRSINRRTRVWFPSTLDKRLEWATRHIAGLEEVGAIVGVSADFIKQAKDDLAGLKELYDWRDKVDDLSEAYTQDGERLQWGDGTPDPVSTRPVDPNLLGIGKTTSWQPALFPRLFDNIDIINKNPACKDDIRRQLAILPPARPAIDLLELTPDARATFNGGSVTIKGHLPKPARFWQIYVDRADARGSQHIGTQARTRYTDYHPLPAKPVTWTYTIELRDKQGDAIGKVSVTSISVWQGRADDGPEG